MGYVASTGVWGSMYAMTWHILILIAQFWIALYPIGAKKPNAESFFMNYLGAIVLIVFWVGHKVYTRNWKLYIKVEDMDINSDRTIFDEEVLNLERQEEAERYKTYSFARKAWIFMFE